MELILSQKRHLSKSIAFDMLGISFIYFMPALSHLLAFPLYYADPMRIVIILAMAHTHRYNVIALGLTIPLFSFIVSSHPALLKSGLISLELLTNILLFFVLSDKLKSYFLGGLVSILASKILYYSLKYLCISSGALNTELFSTPVWIQMLMMLVFAGYLWAIFDRKNARAGS